MTVPLLLQMACLAMGEAAHEWLAMGSCAVPFRYGIVRASFARATRLSVSRWSLVLMGLRLSLHVPVMLQRPKLKERTRRIPSVVCAAHSFATASRAHSNTPCPSGARLIRHEPARAQGIPEKIWQIPLGVVAEKRTLL